VANVKVRFSDPGREINDHVYGGRKREVLLMIGRYIFAFIAVGSVATLGLLAVAFIASNGPVAMGVYDVMALPLVFLAGGVAGVGATAWVRKQQK
jgi:hypothetical protein